jgi:hypothetical protein
VRPLHELLLTLEADWRGVAIMATLADELLNDFDDSDDGEENEEEKAYHPQDEDERVHNGENSNGVGTRMEGLEVPAVEDDMDDAEEEVEARGAGDILEDEDDTKAKVEKMQLGGVSDVRNVAGLMKTLQPILEVSQHISSCRSCGLPKYDTVLTCFVSPNRKSITTNRYRLHNEQRASDR